MFYYNSLNLIQVGGGTQVKQGDLGSKFSYKLANEKDQELDDFDKEVAHINLVFDDKIVFTTTATVDNSTVTFNIDKAIPTGPYYLEIKIRDYIFPSDKQTIIFVESGAVAYDLKELVPNYDTNMTLQGILSDLSQKGIDISDLNRQLAKKANKDEVTNVMTPKGTLAYASLPTSGNQVGWYYYCPDGDGAHGAGNYVWNGTSWFFGGTGDEGYNLLKKDLGVLDPKVTKLEKTVFYPKNILQEPIHSIDGMKVILNGDKTKLAPQNDIYVRLKIYKIRKGVEYNFDSFSGLIINFAVSTELVTENLVPAKLVDYKHTQSDSNKKTANTYISTVDGYLYVNTDINTSRYIVNEVVYDTSKIDDIIDFKSGFGNVTTKSYEDTIIATESNYERIDSIYTSSGGVQTLNNYGSLIYPLSGEQVYIVVDTPGVYGGAFLDSEKNWISSFNGNVTGAEYPIPKNASYIAVTCNFGRGYVTFKTQKTKIVFNNLDYVKTEDLQTSVPSINIWSGKKVVWIGTSVSFGQYSEKSYAKEVADKLGFDLVNCSVPGLAIHTNNGNMLQYGSLALSKSEAQAQGMTIPDAPVIPYVPGGNYNNYYRVWDNVFTQDNADADLWVFDVAPNNSNFDLTDWNLFDKNNWVYTDGSSFEEHRDTFLGALLFLMDKMYTLNPNARMVFVLGSSFAYGNGKQMFTKMSEQWNIPIIDVWGKINTSPKSLSQLKSKNGTDPHPSTFAHEKMGNMLVGEFMSIN